MKETVVLLLMVVAATSTGALVVNVTEQGKDDEKCLLGKRNCSSLGYALKSLTDFEKDVTINVFYSHQMTSNDSITNDSKFYGVKNITILGHPLEEDYITISCPSSGMGLYFNYSTNITIRDMSWVNCGVWHPTTANANWTDCTERYCENLVWPKAMSTLFMFNCTELVLDHTHFSSNLGSGVSLYNVEGVVNITHSVFTNHTLDGCTRINETTPHNSTYCSPQATGLYIEMTYCPELATQHCPFDNTSTIKTHYNIHSCLFLHNNNSGTYRNITDIPTSMELNDTYHWPFGRGGGMGVVLRAFDIEHFSMNICNNVFDGNRAVYGGGMHFMLHSGYPDRNYITWMNNRFSNNKAEYNGGGLSIVIDVEYNTNVTEAVLKGSLRNHLFLGYTNFTNNTAYWGGGVAFTAYPLNVTKYLDMEIVVCDFTDNQYSGGGGAIALLRKEKPEKEYFFIAKVSFYACTFSRTVPVLARAYSQQIISSTVHSEGIELIFYNVTVFENNCASALRLSDTGAVFHDDVTFSNNTGYDGGGVSLTGKSWITLADGVRVQFVRNRAYRYGGAIFYNPSPVSNMNMTGSCFVWYQPPSGNVNVPVQDWWINVSFTGNSAVLAGDAAYVTDPQQCVWPNQLSLFNPNRTEVFNYSGQETQNTHVVSTPSKHLSFSSSSNYFVRAQNDLDYAEYDLMPGQSLDLKLVTSDSTLSHQVILSTLICVTCHSKKDYESYNHQIDACGKDKRYHVDDFNRQVLSGSTLSNFKVYGPDVSNNGTNAADNDTDLILVFKTDDPIPVILPLLIKFRQCSNGFQYSKEKKACVCLQNPNADLSPVVCTSDNGSTNEIPCIRNGYWYGKLDDTFAYHFCHNDRCRGSHIDSCSGYHGYIKLPNDDSSLCTNGLQGPLCTECNGTHSLAYNSYECVKCGDGRKVGLILLMLFECLVIVVVILGFLKLNMRVTTAGFYGFLYFYSVLRLLIWIPLPTWLDAMIGIIVGVTSLDFQILQYTGMCFSGFRAIHYEVLHYVYPLAVMAMIFMIIKVDQSGWRRSQFFTGESSIQALCIILLITYTSISETSLNILLPLNYESPNDNTSISDWYVHVDPGLRYMDTRNHLPLWLLAMLVELLLVLPFSLLMFIAPWAMRYVNLSKIKPILDEYHNCFHDNCRWFAGVYLLARQVMFFLPIIGQGPDLAIYLQQIFCLLLLLLVATLHPYRQKYLNIIDVLLLSLLTFLSFTSSSVNGRRVYSESVDVQVAVVGVAVIMPCFVLVLVMVGCKVNKLWYKTIVAKRFYKQPMNPVLVSDPDDSEQESFDATIYRGVSSSPRYTTDSVGEDDLPPRFYDEERTHWDEKTPLLLTHGVHPQGSSGTNPRGVKGLLSTQSTAPAAPSRDYSINNRPVTN